MLICKSKTWKFPLRARWWLNVNCLTFMFILLKVPLYVQTKLSMWLEEHITKWTEKSNHQYKAPPAYMDHGKANVFYWEKLFLCLQNCEENQTKINQNQITVCLLGKSTKPIPFSPKLGMLDDSNPPVESHSAVALGRGVGAQRRELSCRRGGSAAAAIPPGHRLGSSFGPLALPSPSFPLMQSKKLHNGGKNKWVLVEPVTWGCAFAVNVSDIQGSGQPGSEGQQPAPGQMNLSQDSWCTCSSLEASLCSLVSPNESFWDKHFMLRHLNLVGCFCTGEEGTF